MGKPVLGHTAGRRARELVEGARAEVAALCHAAPDEVIFTSGATEAINQAIFSAGDGFVLASAVEHPAVDAACASHQRQRVEIPVEERGAVDVERVLRLVDHGPRPALVAVMAANNETGILNPVRRLADELQRREIPFLVDAVQWAGLPIDFRPDYLVLTAHKLGGPKGAGALVVAGRGAPLPLIAGGGQEGGHRGGTEAVPAIAGFGEAVRRVRDERDAQSRRLPELRVYLETELLGGLPGARVVGADVARLPNTVSLTLPDVLTAPPSCSDSHTARLPSAPGVLATRAPVVRLEYSRHSGFTDAEAHRTLRFSLGWQTTRTDVDRLVDASSILTAPSQRGGRP